MTHDTDVHCTNCGKELELYDDVVISAPGSVQTVIERECAAVISDAPYLEILCWECWSQMLQPICVVVEVKDGQVTMIRASSPAHVAVTVLNHDLNLDVTEQGIPYPAEYWGDEGDKPIGQLNAVKELPKLEDSDGNS